MGTSSARPSNLDGFTSRSRGADDTLRGHDRTLGSAYDAFVAGTHWGVLDADSMLAGFAKYIDRGDDHRAAHGIMAGSMTTGLRYDESNIVVRLSELSPQARTMFAASAAERLFALYEWYAERASHADPAKLREALDLAWSAVCESLAADDLSRWQDAAEELVPDDEDEGWTEQTAYGENGAAAVAYALCVARTGDPQEAGWAALQLYEAADYAAQRQLEDVQFSDPGGEDALADQPVVQAALQAIEDDLAATERETAIDEARGRAREGGLRLAELAGRASA